jgi:hypothetical protein
MDLQGKTAFVTGAREILAVRSPEPWPRTCAPSEPFRHNTHSG